MCCGQKRAALGNNAGSRVPPAAEPGLKLAYMQSSPIEVRGPATGRAYHFSENRREQLVDPRDAIGLLRTQLFRQSR